MNNDVVFFGNVYINTEESLIRMRDSIESIELRFFDQIIINIRGDYHEEALEYLSDRGIVNIFNLESSYGWFHDSYSLLKDIKQKYVYIWLEDFICLNVNEFENYINLVKEYRIDIARYTFKESIINTFENEDIIYEDASSLLIDTKANSFNKTSTFIISFPSILKKGLLYEILLSRDDNSIWDIKTPFGFEKNSNQIQWLPLKMGFPKTEIFASIDDDHDVKGSSLQSRGLYPIRTQLRNNSNHLKVYLRAGKRFKLKGMIKKLNTFFEITKALFSININFNLFLKLIRNINYLRLDLYSLNFLNIINSISRKKIFLFTLNNELEELKMIFKAKDIEILTNQIYQLTSNKKINLKPKPYGLKDNGERVFQGFSIEADLNFDDVIEGQIVMKKVIYLSLSDKVKSHHMLNDVIIFD